MNSAVAIIANQDRKTFPLIYSIVHRKIGVGFICALVIPNQMSFSFPNENSLPETKCRKLLGCGKNPKEKGLKEKWGKKLSLKISHHCLPVLKNCLKSCLITHFKFRQSHCHKKYPKQGIF